MPVFVPPGQVILRVLQLVRQRVGKPIHRTHLVKLVYLVDYLTSRTTGQPLTGLRWTSDNFGPNAWGNQIVRSAEALQEAGAISITEELLPSGNFKFLYEAIFEEMPQMPPLAERIIDDVVREYGHVDWREAVKAAKSTQPYRDAVLGDVIRFPQPSDDVLAREAEVDRIKARESYNETGGQGTGLRELKTRYGISG